MHEDDSKHVSEELSAEERQQYLRHLALPQFGEAGQRILKHSHVLIIGAGGLGSPAALYLAAAGIGTIGIIDDDQVDQSNLQRQILHGSSDVGNAKVTSAKQRLEDMNPFIHINTYEERLNEQNAKSIIERYDVIIDGTDNFPTRYLINDTCHFLGKPWIYGSIFRFDGQASVFGLNNGPCYRCLYPVPPGPEEAPDCSQAGVLGVLPGVIGTIQATEAIKVITGIGEVLSGRVLFYDALNMGFKTFNLAKDPDCTLCGSKPSITSIRLERDAPCSAAQDHDDEIDASTLKSLLDSDEPPFLIDVREEWEHALCDIGNSKLIPVAELENRVDEIPKRQKVVIFCRSGVRTRQALNKITNLPANVCHLKGGILAWANEIDPSIPKY